MTDQSVTLRIHNTGSRWWIGWPFEPTSAQERRQDPSTLYRLPGPVHDVLRGWWGERDIEPASTISALVAQLDRAVERHPPPVPFRLVRLGHIVRAFQGASR